MAIIAEIIEGKSSVTVYGLWQFDYGQQLEIRGLSGLPAITPVHFAIEDAESAEIRTGTYADGVLTCAIPDAVLRQASPVWAYVYIDNGESGQTIKAVRICITPRAEPSEVVTPEQKSAFGEMVAELNGLIAAVEGVNDEAMAQADRAEDEADNAAESAIIAANNILNGVSTHNASEAAHEDIRSDIRSVEAIARGRATAQVFDTYADMIAWLAVPANVEGLVVGDNLYIRDTGVKDYWWDGTSAQELEAEAPDLTDYYTKVQTDAKLPLTVTQSAYDALVAAGTTEAGRTYFTV